jgi:hypothetical protein
MWTRVRFRVLVPLLNVAMAVVLLDVGQAQWKKIASHGMSELLPDLYRSATYVDYALNAPAWAAQMNMPWLLHVKRWRMMETERDWWYLLFVAVMWFHIGSRLDKRLHSADCEEPGPASRLLVWRKRVVAALSLSYAVFMVNTAFDGIGPYETRFVASVFLWALAITLAGLLPLMRRGRPTTDRT